MLDPQSDTMLLLDNVYQWQASRQARQVAMLELISQVITRWSDHADLIMISGDSNASCRPRIVGYAGTEATRGADARLEEWSRQTGLCAAPSHATWLRVIKSRYAVLDSFFWRSKTNQMGIQVVESIFPPDPRLDHDIPQAQGHCETRCLMPPLEALWVPERIRMPVSTWSKKRADWQDAVTQLLALTAQEEDRFLELDRSKKIEIDCAQEVLGVTGGKL
jgi:hypothetical protein